jgi:L-cysteine:1D-myo-inositol 2-amino-2-deoxy-alpha-D-glucopyranoside ligase
MTEAKVRLHNSYSGQIEEFQAAGKQVSLYACGITPYDTTHLGHAFTYCVTDTLYRYLDFNGYSVSYVQNVTDIDDDILKRAAEVGEDWQALGNRWTRHFIQDMQALNVLPPDQFPRATDVIEEIQGAVQDLLYRGVAYLSNGNVYFDIHAWPEFGKLAKLSYEEMLPIANERGNDPTDVNKRDPLDFVLWQAQKAGEPAWDSPWGSGRPGWHIECSTLIEVHLGKSIDIHIGGADLVFPHHECEIAQAESTRDVPLTRYWMHVAMVEYQGEKMSKSLGNLVMIRDLLEEWTPDEIRAYLASHHYRSRWEHSLSELGSSRTWLLHLIDTIQLIGDTGAELEASSFVEAFQEKMDDDLDTPGAMGILSELADFIQVGAEQGAMIKSVQQTLCDLALVLGIRLDREMQDARVNAGWEKHRKQFGQSN